MTDTEVETQVTGFEHMNDPTFMDTFSGYNSSYRLVTDFRRTNAQKSRYRPLVQRVRNLESRYKVLVRQQKERNQAEKQKQKDEIRQIREAQKKAKENARNQKLESKNSRKTRRQGSGEKEEIFFRVVEGQRAPQTCNANSDPMKIPEPIKNLACIKNSKLPLRYHQMLILKQMFERRGLIAIHAPGSGKTLPAVVITNCFLHPSSQLDGVVIITPKSLMHNFQKEMEAYGVSAKQKGLQYYTYKTFVNYAADKPHILRNKCVIIDEAHNLANANGKTSRLIAERVAEAKKVLLLTATPMKNRVSDMNILLEMVSGVPVQSKKNGPSLEELKCWISYYNCPTSEYFPTSAEHDILLPMSPEFYKKYYAIQKNEIKNANVDADLFGSTKNLAVFCNGIRRASNNLEKTDSPKIQWIMNQLAKGRKTLIYSFFRDSGLNLISKLLRTRDIPFAEINGSLSAKERSDIVKQYNSEKIKILLISKAGGEGLDLKNTDDVILLEPSWHESAEEQIQGRAIRYKSHESRPKGQRHVDIYHLQMTKPIHRDPLDKLDSVDVIMRAGQKKKANIINSFLHEILPYTIEAQNCPRDLLIELKDDEESRLEEPVRTESKKKSKRSKVSHREKSVSRSISRPKKTKINKPKHKIPRRPIVIDSDSDDSVEILLPPYGKPPRVVPKNIKNLSDSDSESDKIPLKTKLKNQIKAQKKKNQDTDMLRALLGDADDTEFAKLKKAK